MFKNFLYNTTKVLSIKFKKKKKKDLLCFKSHRNNFTVFIYYNQTILFLKKKIKKINILKNNVMFSYRLLFILLLFNIVLCSGKKTSLKRKYRSNLSNTKKIVKQKPWSIAFQPIHDDLAVSFTMIISKK